MDAELTRLLGYLDQDGVTELVVGTNQPITVRRAGTYIAMTTEPVSRTQIARWLLGSAFAPLLPDSEGIGDMVEVEAFGRRVRAQIARRGDDLLLRIEPIRRRGNTGKRPQASAGDLAIPQDDGAATPPSGRTKRATGYEDAPPRTMTVDRVMLRDPKTRGSGATNPPPIASAPPNGPMFKSAMVDTAKLPATDPRLPYDAPGVAPPPSMPRTPTPMQPSVPRAPTPTQPSVMRAPSPDLMSMGPAGAAVPTPLPPKLPASPAPSMPTVSINVSTTSRSDDTKTQPGVPKRATSPAIPVASAHPEDTVEDRPSYASRPFGSGQMPPLTPPNVDLAPPHLYDTSPTGKAIPLTPPHPYESPPARPTPQPPKPSLDLDPPSVLELSGGPAPPRTATTLRPGGVIPQRAPAAPAAKSSPNPAMAVDLEPVGPRVIPSPLAGAVAIDAAELDDADDDPGESRGERTHVGPVPTATAREPSSRNAKPPSVPPPLPPQAQRGSAQSIPTAFAPATPMSAAPSAPVSTGHTQPPPMAAAPSMPAVPPSAAPPAAPPAAAPPGDGPRHGKVSLVDEKSDVQRITAIVRAARDRAATDLHIAAQRPVMIRAIGELSALDPTVVTAEMADKLLLPLIGPLGRAQLLERGYVDLAMEVPGAGRLRGNVSRLQGGLKGSFRLAYPRPPTLEELNLPRELAKVVSQHQGLVVIAGPSGHGKTSTLAALVDLINSTKPYHILTVEDPVEIEHPRKRAVVSQREVGRHTLNFAAALKASLREDPDVIVIGELRDRETVEIALTAAETGHLVITTMSTPSAAKTLDRLVDMFPPDDQQQVRASLAGALRAIVAQRLLPRADNRGVVPAVELLTGVLPLASMIRDNKLYQLPNLMQRGRAFGMIRLDDSLADHVRSNAITEEVALRASDNKRELAAMLRPQERPTPNPAAAAQSQPAAQPAKKGFFSRKD